MTKLEIRKTTRGTLLGPVWLFARPALYVFVFWFALEVGLRSSRMLTGDYPFLLWLCCGLFVWFYMQKMLNTGAKVYAKFPHLVKRSRFPLSCISTVFSLSNVFVTVLLMIFLVIACAVFGYGLRWTMVQIPFILLIMVVFFTFFSMLMSPLTAMSKDLGNLMTTLSTPLFWLSGIIYDVSILPWLEKLLAWNPITWFADMMRASCCDCYWIWQRPDLLIPFLVVFFVTAALALLSYKKLSRDVADVL